MSRAQPPQRKHVKAMPRNALPATRGGPPRRGPKQTANSSAQPHRPSPTASFKDEDEGRTAWMETDDAGGPDPSMGRRDRLSIDQITERSTGWTDSAEALLQNRVSPLHIHDSF